MDNKNLEKFSPALSALTEDKPFHSSLQISSSADIDVFYSPFDFINSKAKIVIVGISPGATQAANANRIFRQACLDGYSINEASQKAKSAASFSGPLRNNLVKMLDSIGLNKKLGISTCGSLFESDNHLLHCTSVFRYPTLHNGKPISSAKKAFTSDVLKSMMDTLLIDECRALDPECIFIPLGQGVNEVLSNLAEKNAIDKNKVLSGIPHPSGANAERIAYFLGNKKRANLSVKTNPDKLDASKLEVLNKIAVI